MSRGLVLRDGIPANDPFDGWVYWRAMSSDIDRIEVSPSGASALFGDFALGGVVQILSRPIERREAQAVIAGALTKPMGAVALFDARVARRIGHGLAAFVAGENLFDRRYLVGRAGVDTFGALRTIEAGISLDTH